MQSLLSKPSRYINLRDLPPTGSSLALNIIGLLEVEGMTPQRGPLFIRAIRNQPPVTQTFSQLLSLAPVISVSGVLLTKSTTTTTSRSCPSVVPSPIKSD